MNDNVNMISFSGGRTSAMMTIELLKLPEYNENNTVICFANTGKENEATLEFVNEVGKYIREKFGMEIQWIEYTNIYNSFTKRYSHWYYNVDFENASRKGEPFEELIKVRRFLPNVVSRCCTQELKIKPIKKFMKSMGYKTWNNIVGIRHDEPNRYFNLMKPNKECWENKAPLFEMGVTKEDVIKYWENMPFDLKLKEHQGNCDLCFLKGLSKKITILKENPKIADWWMEQEKKTGATFVKGYSDEQLLNKASKQLEIVYQDADYQDCFCNVD